MGTIESTAHEPDPAPWQRLIEPSPAITDPSERRTARLLAAVLLLTAPLGFVSVAGQVLDAGRIESQHVVGAVAVATVSLTYLLSRTRHFQWAAVVTVLVPTIAGLAVLMADSADPGWFAFMALNPAFGSLLVPARRARGLAGLNLVAVALGVLLIGEVEATTAYVAIIFNTIITAVLLTARRHRDRLEADRRAELLARQRLSDRILEATFGGIGLHRDGRLVQANETFAAMFGRGPQEIVGLELSEFFELESRPLLTHLLSGVDGGSADLVGVRLDGSSFDVEALVPPGASVNDEAHILAVRDISERKRSADALVRAQRMESVGRLAAGIAHDTNNLLAVILIYSERLVEDRTRAGLDAAAEESIHVAAQQIATLLGRLQLVDRGRVDEPVVLDLRSFVADREPMWRQVVDDDLELEVRPGDGVGQVMVDPTNLEQALLNLVLNARDAMPRGGRLLVALDGVELDDDAPAWAGDLPEGHYQRVRVIDDGTGIAPENLERIFEPFFTTKAQDVGTGIGLYTSREVIEAAGGVLTVQAELGATTFHLLLPDAR